MYDNLLGIISRELGCEYLSDLHNIPISKMIEVIKKINIKRYPIDEISYAFSYIFGNTLNFISLEECVKYLSDIS